MLGHAGHGGQAEGVPASRVSPRVDDWTGPPIAKPKLEVRSRRGGRSAVSALGSASSKLAVSRERRTAKATTVPPLNTNTSLDGQASRTCSCAGLTWFGQRGCRRKDVEVEVALLPRSPESNSSAAGTLPLTPIPLDRPSPSPARYLNQPSASMSYNSDDSNGELDLEDDLSISSPVRGQTLGDALAEPVTSPSSSQKPAPPAQGPSREARAAAALARLAPTNDKGESDPDGGTLKEHCLLEKERDWQRFIERSLVGPNTYIQVGRLAWCAFALGVRLTSHVLFFRPRRLSVCVGQSAGLR